MVYIGVGGDIDGQVNPTLMVHEGELVQINLINGEGAEHDVVIDQYAARSSIVVGKNASSTFSFTAGKVGEFAYFCSIAGHRQAGMEGLIQVMAGPREAMASDAADVVRDPADLPGPIGQRAPKVVRVDLETVELVGQLDDGTTYTYWTFDAQGSRTVRPGAGRRYGRSAPEERRPTASWRIRSISTPRPDPAAARTPRRPTRAMRRS